VVVNWVYVVNIQESQEATASGKAHQLKLWVCLYATK